MSSESSIVFLDVDEQDSALVHGRFPEAVILPATLRDEALVEACRDARVISTFITTPFPRTVLAHLPSLKLLCTRSVGFDHINLEYAKACGITVCNVPDYGSHVIAEYVFALLLSTLRHISEGDKRVTEGRFEYRGLRGMALNSKTLGIVGTGKIGRKVAQIAHGFEMKILAADVYQTVELTQKYGVEYVEREELFRRSDIITLHAPALPETRHMINAQALATMKDGVILVNTARGSLIDTAALVHALRSGKVSHALLDVLENETGAHESESLVGMPGVVTTPHIAFYADDSLRNMYHDCFESIEQWQRGERPAHTVEPLHVVPAAQG